MIKLGDKGKDVSKLQKHLSMIGYDLVIDGVFDGKTMRSLKAFQKKYGLSVSGIADSQTFSALKCAQKRTSKEDKDISLKIYKNINVDSSNTISPEQYIKQKFKKNKIFIHHTSTGPDASKLIKCWDENIHRISSAFVINGRGEEDGKIYESYNPDYWSYHLGVKSTSGSIDKNSIGIEICAWGIIKKKDNKFFSISGVEIPEDEIFTLEDKWRGEKYYHKYSDQQIMSLELLLLWIIKEYDIEIQNIEFDKNWLEYNEELIKNKSLGVFTHSSVRKDVCDIYPDNRIFELLNKIKNKKND